MTTEELLGQRTALEETIKEETAALLQERIDLDAATEKRQAEITAELKALGYKRPRAKKSSVETTAETSAAE